MVNGFVLGVVEKGNIQMLTLMEMILDVTSILKRRQSFSKDCPCEVFDYFVLIC